jgi:hypothetical protein
VAACVAAEGPSLFLRHIWHLWCKPAFGFSRLHRPVSHHGASGSTIIDVLCSRIGTAVSYSRKAKRVELCGVEVPALKRLCEQHNLSKAGVKADLVWRLCNALVPVAIAKRTSEEASTGEAPRETKLA